MANPGAAWYEHDHRYADRNQDPILKPNKKHKDVLAAVTGTPGVVLDVGCGVGNFLAYARAQGWEPWGIDFDQDAIEAGSTTFGLGRLYVMDLAQFAAAHPDQKFDLITFFDVFEHLDNHTDFIREVETLLAPGGRIAFSVPYRHGMRWLLPHDLPPRHLTRWDEQSLRMFFGNHGFSIPYMHRLPASLYYMVLKFRFRYGAWTSFGLVRKVKERSVPHVASKGGTAAPSKKVRAVAILAKAKDMFFFGIPATILWVALLPTRRRYTDLYAVATRT